VFDSIGGWVEVRFTQAARKHRVGPAAARHVMAHAAPTATLTTHGAQAWLWVGADDRGRELEVIAVQAQSSRDPEPVLLVIHVMPTHLRGGHTHG